MWNCTGYINIYTVRKTTLPKIFLDASDGFFRSNATMCYPS